MNADILYIIKVILGVITAVFFLMTAIFTFVGDAQNEKIENTQVWFRTKWEAINNSRWLTLPENSTRWLLNSRVFLSRLVSRILDSELILTILFGNIPFLLFIACYMYWGKLAALISFIVTFPIFLIPIDGLLRFLHYKRLIRESDLLDGVLRFKPFKYLFFFSIGISGLMTTFLWLQIILIQNLYYATFIMILFIPFFWLTILSPIAALDHLATLNISSSVENTLTLFLIGVAGGFTVTLLALSLGHLVEPSAHVPQTLQMLISNVMLDGLTMAVTFAILAKALSKEGLLRLPVAIVFDILVAGIFAVCSLYFGLVLTDKSIGLKETFYILFARSADNSHFELSPYFWVMHTTFIPTLLYLLLILFCWVSKALLIPVRWFFGLGQANKNPMRLTAGLCGIFFAVFGIFLYVATSAHERAKDVEQNQKQQVIGNTVNESAK